MNSNSSFERTREQKLIVRANPDISSVLSLSTPINEQG